MIEIEIFSCQNEKIIGFEVTGHSGTAVRGEDVICAGVSSLTQTALLGLGEYLHRDLDYSVASGKLSMKLRDTPDSLTEAILQTMLLGLIEIEKFSPKAVRISRQRR